MITKNHSQSPIGYGLGMLLGLLAVLSVAGCKSDSLTKPVLEDASLEYQVTQLTTKNHIPGAIGALWTRSGITDIQASGIRRVGHSEQVTTNDYMHFGSLGKFMTSTMIGKLVDQGYMAWTTRPIDVFPELAATIDSNYRDITLIDLLRHRAGVPTSDDFDSAPKLTGSLRDQRVQVMYLILSMSPAAPRGTFYYSNIGYTIAAAMAEKVTNEDWRSLMTEKLFQPLGITPAYGWPLAHDANEPWGHEPTGSGYVPVDSSVDSPIEFLEPSGFISLTMEDYSKFIRLFMDALAGAPRILSAPTFDSLTTPVGGYACGISVVAGSKGAMYWHDGSNDYFHSIVYMIPQLDLAIAYAVNAGGESISNLLAQASDSVLLPLIRKKLD